MNQLLTLVEREVRNAPWKRLCLGLFLIALAQMATALASEAHLKHRIEWPALFFFLWLFGFVAALGLTFDRVSSERESGALDLLLTAGASRGGLIAVKTVAAVLISAALAAGFLAATTLVYAPFVGASAALGVWRHLVPVCAMLTTYGLLGLVCSTIFRTSKAGLLAAFSVALAVRPRILEALVQSVSRSLELGPSMAATLRAISPEMALIHMTGVGPSVGERQPEVAGLVQLGIAALVAALTVVIFLRQEEPSYGD